MTDAANTQHASQEVTEAFKRASRVVELEDLKLFEIMKRRYQEVSDALKNIGPHQEVKENRLLGQRSMLGEIIAEYESGIPHVYIGGCKDAKAENTETFVILERMKRLKMQLGEQESLLDIQMKKADEIINSNNFKKNSTTPIEDIEGYGDVGIAGYFGRFTRAKNSQQRINTPSRETKTL